MQCDNRFTTKAVKMGTDMIKAGSGDHYTVLSSGIIHENLKWKSKIKIIAYWAENDETYQYIKKRVATGDLKRIFF